MRSDRDCHAWSSLLVDAVDGTLTTSEHEQFLAHCGACDECRGTFEALAEVRSKMLRLGIGSAPADLRDRVRKDVAAATTPPRVGLPIEPPAASAWSHLRKLGWARAAALLLTSALAASILWKETRSLPGPESGRGVKGGSDLSAQAASQPGSGGSGTTGSLGGRMTPASPAPAPSAKPSEPPGAPSASAGLPTPSEELSAEALVIGAVAPETAPAPSLYYAFQTLDNGDAKVRRSVTLVTLDRAMAALQPRANVTDQLQRVVPWSSEFLTTAVVSATEVGTTLPSAFSASLNYSFIAPPATADSQGAPPAKSLELQAGGRGATPAAGFSPPISTVFLVEGERGSSRLAELQTALGFQVLIQPQSPSAQSPSQGSDVLSAGRSAVLAEPMARKLIGDLESTPGLRIRSIAEERKADSSPSDSVLRRVTFLFWNP